MEGGLIWVPYPFGSNTFGSVSQVESASVALATLLESNRFHFIFVVPIAIRRHKFISPRLHISHESRCKSCPNRTFFVLLVLRCYTLAELAGVIHCRSRERPILV